MVAASVSERTQWMPVIAPLPDKQLITSGRIDSFQDPQTLQHTRYFAIFGSNVKDELSIYLGSYQNQSNLSLELNTDQIRVSFINQAPHQGFLANLPEGAFFIPTHIIAPAFSRPPQFVMFFGPDAKTPLQNVQVWLN